MDEQNEKVELQNSEERLQVGGETLKNKNN
jgi:hypothetical protein